VLLPKIVVHFRQGILSSKIVHQLIALLQPSSCWGGRDRIDYNCGLQICQIRIWSIIANGENCRRRLSNMHCFGWLEKNWLNMEWAKLDHAVIAAAICQWCHHHLGVQCIKAGSGHLITVCCCCWRVEQLHTNKSVYLLALLTILALWCNI